MQEQTAASGGVTEKMDEKIVYSQWTNKTEARLDKNQKPITVRVVTKSKISCTIRELIQATENQLAVYMTHVYNVRHQYKQMRDMRTRLQQNEVLIVVDFSE